MMRKYELLSSDRFKLDVNSLLTGNVG